MIRTASNWPRTPRRGLTLIEMMVTVALVLMIMVIVVSIFAAATTAISGMQVYQDLDQNLRRFDTTIRQDLAGTTARMTPPLNPNQNLGYFEYGENAFADIQGEDTDDYLAFTVKAPEGHPFTGRAWVSMPNSPNNLAIQPVTITSQFAEVVYFLRNENLYRRVLLIVPERQQSLITTTGPYNPVMFNGLLVSWQGMNDLSAHPSGMGGVPTLNTLGMLTNRENRFARPRFTNDYVNNGSGGGLPDGLPDDTNLDGIPDFYPTFYLTTLPDDRALFPYIFPGAYSQPDPNLTYGRVHGLVPLNHAPLEIGDGFPNLGPVQRQTWWGFPTWRETMSPAWTDPVKPISAAPVGQSPGLSWARVTPLPAMTNAFRDAEQPFNDGVGASSPFANPPALWAQTWEDDLILTGVRSFDVKAYDLNPPTALNLPAGFYDLGYGDNVSPPSAGPFLTSTPPNALASFAHEGRMPPLLNDFRQDPQWPFTVWAVPPAAPTPNLVGDTSASTIRMCRVWDTWSTEYTNAPEGPITNPLAGPPYAPPAFASFPAPYPSPLRAIQINIRVVDPRNERIRVLTIRQDFTDKL